MASDRGRVSTVEISMHCVVQQKIAHCWMGQTPCDEVFVGRNAVSVRISVTVKKFWGIIVDAFVNFWERKCYDGYSIMPVWQ